MRPRFALVAAVILTLTMAVAPELASAAPRQGPGLTITATPDPVNAGQGVLIYGQLQGPNNAGQTINLYHHIDGSHRGYTFVRSTMTDSTGFYELPRPEGVIYTNRSWFVTGPSGTHSPIVHEAVTALVSLQAQSTSVYTDQPDLFTGTVTPDHSGEYVLLQQRISPDDWKTLKRGLLATGSAYSIPYSWKRPGVHDVRVLFPPDMRNAGGMSDPVTVTIQQTQVPDFTIGSSQPVAPLGATVTISGTLDMPGTTSPEPDTPVQLWGRIGSAQGFTVLGNTTTDSQGNYSFAEANETYNTVYFASTLPGQHVSARRTARLNQGVQDALTLQASATNVLVNQVVLLTGTVMPDKAGEPIYLESQGADHDWQVVAIGQVRHNSTYLFRWRSGAPGSFTLRTRILSDGDNVGARSAPVAVTVGLPTPSGP
jgi:hypothetical protein